MKRLQRKIQEGDWAMGFYALILMGFVPTALVVLVGWLTLRSRPGAAGERRLRLGWSWVCP